MRGKKKRSTGEVLRRIALVICALVFLTCAGYLIALGIESYQKTQSSRNTIDLYISAVDSTLERPENSGNSSISSEESDDGEEDETVTIAYTVDFDALLAQSSNVVGWIQVSGLDNINYPIVQYTDNNYYLTHDWDGQYSRYGAIFLDADNSGDFSDAYSLIYGHNMKNGSMFGTLKQYRDASFFAENGGIITIYLPTETRTYQIFSVRVVDASDESAYTIGFGHDEQFGTYLQKMVAKSLYQTGVSVSAEDSVITLSTCSGDNRLVVHAKLVATVPVT